MAAMTRTQVLRVMLTYGAIIGATLAVVDLACMALGLFPPTPVYGDAELGWRPASATGHMALGRCVDVATGHTVDYDRNEDGVRTNLSRGVLAADTASLKIAVVGDSHTDLCVPNDLLHAGVMESALKVRGVPALAFSYGAGKYSPLQDYLAFRQIMRPYRPRVLVMNFYTGNDFYDILRLDDRPHFTPTDSGYRVDPPTWYSLDDPAVKFHSRVLFAGRALLEKVGVRRLYQRVMELRRVASQQGAGLTTVYRYIRDLYQAREPTVGYPDAFTSQMLNQQLFFYHFPASREESLRRIRALLVMARAENPDLILVLSPIPSYQLTGEQPVDSALLRTVSRIPVSLEAGATQEHELYEALRGLAQQEGWLFVDNLAGLKGYHGPGRLYNTFDYHILPLASRLIGEAQARVLFDTLQANPR
jgi:hypothetical protein